MYFKDVNEFRKFLKMRHYRMKQYINALKICPRDIILKYYFTPRSQILSSKHLIK